MSKRYGLPYMGSKNAIAAQIVEMFPQADNFYDLFAGGCAVAHAALESGKFKRIYINDINGSITQLFMDAINGKFADEKRWISRKDFFAQKDSDPYIKYCWSFGNRGEDYLYSREIEPWKEALHFAYVFKDYSYFEKMGIFFNDYVKSDLKKTLTKNSESFKKQYQHWYCKKHFDCDFEDATTYAKTKKDYEAEQEKLRLYLCDALKKSGLKQSDIDKATNTQMSGHWFGKSQWQFPTPEQYAQLQCLMPLTKTYEECTAFLRALEFRLQRLQRLQSLQSLQRLQRLQSLQSLESLQCRIVRYCDSYANIKIEPNSLIYCDIPYKDTEQYSDAPPFDHQAFYEWASNQKELVIISEYNMPERHKKQLQYKAEGTK